MQLLRQDKMKNSITTIVNVVQFILLHSFFFVVETLEVKEFYLAFYYIQEILNEVERKIKEKGHFISNGPNVYNTIHGPLQN